VSGLLPIPEIQYLAYSHNAADQTHVVKARQPEDADAAAGMLEGVGDEGRIVDQVGVRQHHALGIGRRARGVLQERQRVGGDGRLFPG